MMRTVREGVPQGLIVVPIYATAILSYGPPNASLGLLVRFIFFVYDSNVFYGSRGFLAESRSDGN